MHNCVSWRIYDLIMYTCRYFKVLNVVRVTCVEKILYSVYDQTDVTNTKKTH